MISLEIRTNISYTYFKEVRHMESIKFGSEEEKFLDEYTYSKNIVYVRKVIAVCIFLYGGFAILDYFLYPDLIRTFSIIRFGIVIPSFLLFILFSYAKFFKKFSQLLTSFIYFLSGLGIIAMIYMIEGVNYYYSGLFLIFSAGFFLIKLKLLNSIIIFSLLVFTFIILGLLYSDYSVLDIFVHSFFYISFGLIGIFGSSHIENYEKQHYIQEMNYFGEKIGLETQIVEQLQEINIANETTILSIAKLAESRDRFTGEHLDRVGSLCLKLSEKIPESIFIKNNLQKDQFLKSIKLASVLHDIGKIAISDVILNKESKLTFEEFEIMKTHAQIGANTLMSIDKKTKHNNFISLGIEISKYHHEKWDGTGYPTGIKGNAIPLSARIVSIVDVFDALISKRPYKDKYSKDKSLKLIKKDIGTHFDPVIAKIFFDITKQSRFEELFWK